MIAIMLQDWRSIFADAPERDLERGDVLFRQGDRIVSMHLVRSGCIELVRHLEEGAALVLQTARGDRLLAEASLFSRAYHCDAVAAEASRLAVVTVADFKTHLATSHGRGLGLTREMAFEVQALRSRIELLRMKRLGDRLDAYLALHGEPAPGGWVRVASEIGVRPEALYRELARRRDS